MTTEHAGANPPVEVSGRSRWCLPRSGSGFPTAEWRWRWRPLGTRLALPDRHFRDTGNRVSGARYGAHILLGSDHQRCARDRQLWRALRPSSLWRQSSVARDTRRSPSSATANGGALPRSRCLRHSVPRRERTFCATTTVPSSNVNCGTRYARPTAELPRPTAASTTRAHGRRWRRSTGTATTPSSSSTTLADAIRRNAAAASRRKIRLTIQV